MNELITKFSTELLGALGVAVAGLILPFVLSVISKVKSKLLGKRIDSAIEAAMEIHGYLVELRNGLKAGRAYVFEIDKPNKNTLLSFRCVYESCAPGVSSSKAFANGFVISGMPQIISDLRSNKHLILDSETVEDDEVHMVLVHQGVRVMVLVTMTNRDGAMMGLIGVDFMDLVDISEEDMEKIKQVSLVIGHTLSGIRSANGV
jgi:hypothetical protein